MGAGIHERCNVGARSFANLPHDAPHHKKGIHQDERPEDHAHSLGDHLKHAAFIRRPAHWFSLATGLCRLPPPVGHFVDSFARKPHEPGLAQVTRFWATSSAVL